MSPVAGQDSFLLEALFRNEAWGHMLAPVSEANERAVYQSMLEGCQAALDGCASMTLSAGLCLYPCIYPVSQFLSHILSMQHLACIREGPTGTISPCCLVRLRTCLSRSVSETGASQGMLPWALVTACISSH